MGFTQINVHDTVSIEAEASQALTAVIDLGSQSSWTVWVTWKRQQYTFVPAKEVNRCTEST